MNSYKIELKWGLIFIAATLLWTLIERISGLHSEYIDKHMIYTNIFAIPAIAIYVMALLDKRKNFYGGKMTWMQGFLTGMIVSAVIVVLCAPGQWITHEIISPGYFPAIIAYSVESGELSQGEAETYFSLKNYVIQSIAAAMLMGMISSALIALIVKK